MVAMRPDRFRFFSAQEQQIQAVDQLDEVIRSGGQPHLITGRDGCSARRAQVMGRHPVVNAGRCSAVAWL
jgi:hypothetical protein